MPSTHAHTSIEPKHRPWMQEIEQLSGVPISEKAQREQYAVVYLLLDISGSMAGSKLAFLKQGAAAFIRDAFDRQHRVGIIQFNSHAVLAAELTRDGEALSRAIKRLEAGGGTYFVPPLELGWKGLQAYGGLRSLCLVTDGQSNTGEDSERAITLATKIKRAGVRVLTIGTEDADRAFLEKIASHTKLATHVPATKLATAIADSAKLLPGPNEAATKPRLLSWFRGKGA